MTQYERIKNMSIEEMADALKKADCEKCEHKAYCGLNIFPYVKCEICLDLWIDWLESEADEND